jgi:hypothetical protein
LALFLVVAAEQLLQKGGESLVCAVGRGNEGSQASKFEEAAQGSDPGDAKLLKDEMEGEQELLEEGEPCGRFKESDEGLWCREALLPLLPVVEGGVRQARRFGEVASGLVSVVRVESLMEVAYGFGAAMAERLFRAKRGRGRVVVTHGSCLLLGV